MACRAGSLLPAGFLCAISGLAARPPGAATATELEGRPVIGHDHRDPHFRRRANAGPQIDSAAAPQVGPRLAIGLVTEGEDRRLDAVLQGELGEDAADVGLDGLLADRQIPGDLPVAVTAGDQPEYFPLAR